MKNVLFFILLFGLFPGCVILSKGINEQVSSSVLLNGSAMGYMGPIIVQVRMNGESITEIVIIDSMEDRFVGGSAIEELIDTVIEYNSTDIDVISGATVSSMGFLEAVNNAIMGYE
jgi:uncharacterized protein with FMN-binding domain